MNVLSLRSKAANKIRNYFNKIDLVETITPLLLKSSTLEPYLEPIKAIGASTQWVLPTSPEFGLKKQLAYDTSNKGIFEIAHAFRDDIDSNFHAKEFIMVEWYKRNSNYLSLKDDVLKILKKVSGDKKFLEYKLLSIKEVFLLANLTIDSKTDFKKILVDLKYRNVQELIDNNFTNHDAFEIIFDELIIPLIQTNATTFLYDFPSFSRGMSCLNKQGWSERIECYLYGIEIANGYQELYNKNELKELWLENNKIRKSLNKPIHAIDENLISLSESMKGVAGMALGLERLLMVTKRIDSINQFQ